MSGMLSTTNNARAMLFDRLLGLFTVGLFGLALARMMTVEEYAEWSIIVTYSSIVALFARGGIDTQILIDGTRTYKDYTIQFIQLKLVMLVPIAFVVLGYLSYALNQINIIFLALFVFSNGLIIFETIEIKFKSTGRFHWIFYRKIRFRLFGFFLKLLLFICFKSLSALLIGFVLEYMIHFIFYPKYIELKKIWKDFKTGVITVWKWDLTYLILTSIVVWVYMKFAFLYIVSVGSSEDIAQFYLSNKIIEILLVVPPILVVDSIKKLANKNYNIVIKDGVKILLIVLIVNIGATFLPRVFGENYSNIDKLVRIMVWVLPIAYSGEVIEKMYVLNGRKKAVLIRCLVGLIFGVVYVLNMSNYTIYTMAYLVVFLQAATNLFYPIIKILINNVRFFIR